ncbi:MAG: CHAT domain-containing tetratricopeptide repeat protein [Bacteroidota bacterium]
MATFIYCFFSLFFFVEINSTGAVFPLEQKSNLNNSTSPDTFFTDTLLAQKKLDESIALFKKSEFNKALQVSREALQLIGNDEGKIKGEIFANFGRCHLRLQNNDLAINYFEKAGAVYQQIEPVPHKSIAYNFSNIGICHKNQEKYGKAIEFYQKAIDYAASTIGENIEGIGNAHMNKGNIFRRLGQYEKAISSYEKSIGIFKEVLQPPHVRFGIVYTNLGLTHENIKDFEKANYFNQKALQSFLATVGDKHYYTYSLYHNMGIIFKETGEYAKALDYERKALAIGREMFSTDPVIGDIYTMMGSAYREMGELEPALNNYQKGFDFKRKHYPDNEHSLTHSYNGLGLTYTDLGEFDKAIYFFEKDIAIEKNLFGDNYPDLAYTLNSLASVYFKKKEFNTALKYYHKSFDISNYNFGENHPRTAFVLVNIGNLYLEQNKWEEALNYFERAEKSFGVGESLEKDWPDLSSYSYLPKIFYGKGKALEAIYANTNDLAFLEKAISNWSKGVAYLEHLRWSLETARSKNILTEKSYPIYEGAIRSNLLAYEQTNNNNYLNNIFTAFEKSKNFLMLQTISSLKAKQFSSIPDSLLEKEKQLKTEIAWLETQHLKEREEKKINESKIDSLSESIFFKKKLLVNLIRSYEEGHPKYFELKYGTDYTTIKSLQKKLAPNQTLLEYFVGKNDMYIFVVSPKGTKVIKTKIDFPLERWITELRESITDYPTANNKSEKLYNQGFGIYQKTAHQLFQKLIAPIGELSESLIIVPDDVLWNIPFEVLLKHENGDKYKSLPFLLLDHNIAYGFSATLWQEIKQLKSSNKKLLAIAPSFKQSDFENTRDKVFKELKFNKTEVIEIVDKIGGTSMTDTFATKNAFIKIGKQYALLHLATHVYLDENNSENSYLAFSPSDSAGWKLYVRDLYNQYFPSEMVVLSACKSGVGKIQKGEGLISLSRGFAYAGAKSLVTSLWQVNDRATSNIMTSFYEGLKLNKNKDTALRQAKIEYLKNQKEDHLASPFYWAAFVALGNMETIGFNSSHYFYYLSGAVFVLALAFYFKKKFF